MVVFSIPAAISTAAQLRLRIGLTVVMLAIFCSGSWLQSRYWLSTFTLFSRAQEVTKDNWLAYDQLGLVAYRNGNMDLAEGYCRRSLRLNEIDPVANYNLGIALARKGQFKSAIPFYQASMVLQPDSPEAHVMLGVALEQTGDLQGAYANYERATEIAPEYASAHGAMGVILARIGLSDKAVAELRTALKLQPSDETPRQIFRRRGNGKTEIPAIGSRRRRSGAVTSAKPCSPKLANYAGWQNSASAFVSPATSISFRYVKTTISLGSLSVAHSLARKMCSSRTRPCCISILKPGILSRTFSQNPLTCLMSDPTTSLVSWL
jgi:Flp pilus assembly protein TadD